MNTITRKAPRAALGALLAVALLGVGAWAQGATGGALLLELGVGARPLGMGGAFVGVADGPAAAFYNPAGLAFLSERRLSGFASRPFEALDYFALQAVLPQLGLTVIQLDLPNAWETNAFGTPTGRALRYTSRAGVASAGFQVGAGLALGAQAKLYLEDNGPVRGVGWALDPALLYANGALRLGAVWRNALNAPIAYDNGTQQPWTGQLILGGSWAWAPHPQVLLRLAADAAGLLDGTLSLHLGAELWLDSLGLRLGWDRNRLTAGASVVHRDLQVHLAYAFHATLPQTAQVSASWAF